ncbi:MAG: DUF6541 family protein [Calditrichia bacterium]
MAGILFSLIYIYGLGYAFLLFCGSSYKPLLNFVLAGLFGIGFSTVLMFLLDILGLSISAPALMAGWIVVLLLFLSRHFLTRRKIDFSPFYRSSFRWREMNPATFVFVAAIILLVAGSFIKNMYWPVQAYDSVAGYDLMGRIISIEKTFNVSLHNYDLAGPRGIYPPLVEGSFALFYLLGASSAKILNTIFYVSLLILVYQFIRKELNSIAAGLFTLILALTPELFAHSSLSLTNIPGALYVTGGLLFLYEWWRSRQFLPLMFSGLLFGLNAWARSDGIIFCIAATAILLVLMILEKQNFMWWVYHSLAAFLPFIGWQIYLKLAINAESIERFRTYFFWDGERFQYMISYMFTLFKSTPLYGWIFYIFLLALVINIRRIKANWPLLAYLVSAYLLYSFTFYQLDPETQDSIQTMMRASFKRGLFYFIPGILFYSVLTPYFRKFFNWLEMKYQKFVKSGG